jgi:hypothetical protein
VTALVAAVVGGRLLVRSSPVGPVLPEASEAREGPSPDQLAAAWDATTARPLAPALLLAQEPALTLHVVALDAVPSGAGTLGAAALDRLAHPPVVAATLGTELAVLHGRTPPPARRPDWYRPAWWAEIDDWVDQGLAAAGLRRRGPSRPVKVWSLSAVLEIPVEDGSVFVKAVCRHFGAEPALTAWVGGLAPGSVPLLLATEPTRGWMLMRAFTGAEGDERPDTAPEAARTLAAIQLAAVGRSDELLHTGAPDRTSGPTLSAFRAVIQSGLGLGSLSADERGRIASLPARLAERLDALEATGLPPSLVHGDLHTGNYVTGPDGVLLFDWTDAALGHPVLDAVLLAGSAGRAGPQLEQATLAAYAGVWRAARPDVDIDAALTLAPEVDLAYQSVSYDALVRAQEDLSQWEMQDVVVHCLQKLLALDDGR